ncbi:E3 SUMO-protein ligase pli1-like [Rhopalosiphum maidis]|nr:E3 SUMO-protein ligase pli1-like [Rhopalosiphum maidis]
MCQRQPSNKKIVNLYISNAMPRTKYNVVFQPQPFFKKIHSVIEPMAIYCESKVKLENGQPQEHALFKVNFTLPMLIKSILSDKTKNFRLQIRFGESQEGKRDLLDKLPGLTKICVNSKLSSTTKTSPINYKIYKNLIENNYISVLWPICKKPYYMSVDIVEIISVKDLVERIQFNNRLCSVKLNTKAKAIELMKSSVTEILDSTSFKFILLCPISKLKMKLPTRSLKCSHLQCFDLYTFILLNKVNQKWICPICKIPILINELVIDSFLLDIVNNSTLPENCFEITLYANGEWVPCVEEAMDGIEYNRSESDDENSENTIVLKDLDDPDYENLLNENNFNEDKKPEEKPILPITDDLKPSEPMLIDLTIDDTDIKEEPLTKIIKTEYADE